MALQTPHADRVSHTQQQQHQPSVYDDDDDQHHQTSTSAILACSSTGSISTSSISKYPPMTSLRAQLNAERSRRASRKSSSPPPPRHASASALSKVPTACYAPTTTPMVAPLPLPSPTTAVVWARGHHHHHQPPLPSLDTPSSSTSSLAPHSELIGVNRAHSLPRIDYRHSSSSTASDGGPNLVQFDSMTRAPSAKHSLVHSATTSSSSTANSSDVAAAHHHQQSPSSSSAEAPTTSSADIKRRRAYRVALNFFNTKPDRGLQLLVDWRFVHEQPASVARFLFTRRGLSKKQIGEFVGTLRSNYHARVLSALLDEIPMTDLGVDQALRAMVNVFQLPAEAQKIDHVMQAFARRFRDANLPQWHDVPEDAIYVIAFAIIMLNTDLHSPSLRPAQRMTAEQFVKNTWGAEDSRYFNREYLTELYDRVRTEEMRAGADHVTQVLRVEQTVVGRDKPRLVEQHRRLICYCRVNEIVNVHKRQSPNAHQRDLFLFNDLLLVTKCDTRRKNTQQYIARRSFSLQGLRIEECTIEGFECPIYITAAGAELYLNAKNPNDRHRFIADVQESVSETEEMARVRANFESRHCTTSVQPSSPATSESDDKTSY